MCNILTILLFLINPYINHYLFKHLYINVHFILPNKVFFRFPVENKYQIKNQYKSQIKLNTSNTFLTQTVTVYKQRFHLRITEQFLIRYSALAYPSLDAHLAFISKLADGAVYSTYANLPVASIFLQPHPGKTLQQVLWRRAGTENKSLFKTTSFPPSTVERQQCRWTDISPRSAEILLWSRAWMPRRIPPYTLLRTSTSSGKMNLMRYRAMSSGRVRRCAADKANSGTFTSRWGGPRCTEKQTKIRNKTWSKNNNKYGFRTDLKK